MTTLMTRDEFVTYARECLSREALEPLHDMAAEYNSEVSAFGDAGPGTGLRLRACLADARRLEAALARIERRAPRDLYLPRLLLPR